MGTATELRSIEFLNASGHLSLTWDPSDPTDVERARSEFIGLRDAGYSFFKAKVEDADAEQAHRFEDGARGDIGYLEVRRVQPEEVEPKIEAPRRRGRHASERGERVVAMRPMRGG